MSYLKTLLFSCVFFVFLSTSNSNSSFEVVRENNIAFQPNKKLLDDNGLQYFIEITDKKLHSIEGYNVDSLQFKENFIPLDLYNYWDKKGGENYHVILNKAFYVMEKPIRYFSKERLTNEKFIQKTLPQYQIQKLNEEKFHIDCGSFAPEFDYNLTYHKAPFKNHHASNIVNYIKQKHPDFGHPTAITIQHNYNFGKVLFHKTSKMSVAVYAYYPYKKNQTLVLNYTLNYVHNLPPKLFGGYKFMMQEIVNGMKDLVAQTRKVCEVEV